MLLCTRVVHKQDRAANVSSSRRFVVETCILWVLAQAFLQQQCLKVLASMADPVVPNALHLWEVCPKPKAIWGSLW